MDLGAEKTQSENHNSYARALIDSTSASSADDERELRAGLHPLKVSASPPILFFSLFLGVLIDWLCLCLN